MLRRNWLLVTFVVVAGCGLFALAWHAFVPPDPPMAGVDINLDAAPPSSRVRDSLRDEIARLRSEKLHIDSSATTHRASRHT